MVFDNRVLSYILRPKKGEVSGDCRKLHNEELSDLYCSPNIVRLMNSRKMRWAEHVAVWETGEVLTVFGF